MANSPGMLGAGLAAVIIDPVSVPDPCSLALALSEAPLWPEMNWSESVALRPGMRSSMAPAMCRPHSQHPLELATGDSSGH